jgi:hypothetical protein
MFYLISLSLPPCSELSRQWSERVDTTTTKIVCTGNPNGVCLGFSDFSQQDKTLSLCAFPTHTILVVLRGKAHMSELCWKAHMKGHTATAGSGRGQATGGIRTASASSTWTTLSR